MKKIAKSIVVSILNFQVKKLLAKNSFQIVAVVGSIGKTSTKLSIAQTLSHKYRVQYQNGNYNDVVTVPLVFFGLEQPSLFNPLAWLRIFISIAKQIRDDYPYDVVVLELGTDYPGNIAEFGKCIQVDLAVVTALTPEHMEYFGTLDAVAKEELSVAEFSKKMLINKDLVPEKYLSSIQIPILSYGKNNSSTYWLKQLNFGLTDTDVNVEKDTKPFISVKHPVSSESLAYSVLSAIAVGDLMGLTKTEIESGIKSIKPMSGRMQKLEGLNNSVILDDSYNSSPDAAKLALNTLYRLKGSQKIALLGNMNEMGEYSKAAHEELGNNCDPKQLDLVVTLGPDANAYTAPAAIAKGCNVVTTNSPYKAAEEIKRIMKKHSVILVKGSQNGVFAEESIKLLLADPKDVEKLVRQSKYWLKVKQKQFGRGRL